MGRTEIEAYAAERLRETLRMAIRWGDVDWDSGLDVRLVADRTDGTWKLGWHVGDVSYDTHHSAACAAHTLERDGNDIEAMAADLAIELIGQMELEE